MQPVLGARGKLVPLGVAVVLAATVVEAPRSAAALVCNGFQPTVGQIGGTHFRPSPLRRSVVEPGMAGTRISVSGFVLSSECRPVRGARIDFWQADAGGAYDDRGFRLRAHEFTDARGRYRLDTILPGPYANRTRHLHVTVRARGLRPVTTQLYFPDVALNARDPFFQRRLLVRVRIANHRLLGRFDFVLLPQ